MSMQWDFTKVPTQQQWDFTSVPKKLSFAERLKQRQAEVAANTGLPTPSADEVLRPMRELETSLKGGVGQTIAGAGAVATYLGGKVGLEDAGKPLSEYGTKVSEKNYLEPVKWEGWRTLLNPQFYSRNVARTVPTTAALVVPAALTGGAVAGLGTVAGAVTAGTLNRAMESAMEAGGVYEEALAKGLSKQQADDAADKAFGRNMLLVGLDIGEFAAAFIPGGAAATKLGKTVKAAGRLALAAGQEAIEEGAQEAITRTSLGEKFSITDPRTQEAVAIGGLMGLGLGGAGAVRNMATEIHKAAAKKLPDAQRLALNVEVAERMARGKSREVAAKEAMDTLTAQSPVINAAVRDATAEVTSKANTVRMPLGKPYAWGVNIEFQNPAHSSLYKFGKDVAEGDIEYDYTQTAKNIGQKLGLPDGVDVMRTAEAYYKRVSSEASMLKDVVAKTNSDARYEATPLAQSDLQGAPAGKEPWEMTKSEFTANAVQRIEEPGVQRATTEKPHGIYTTPLQYESPHQDLGGSTYLWTRNPAAKTLTVDASGLAKTNRGSVGKSAGIAALEKLIGEQEASKLLATPRLALTKTLAAKYPNVQWSKYYDTQEMLEGYAGLLARNAGYDAIWAPDSEMPELTEYVGLTEKALTPTENHKQVVEAAIKTGKRVPQEVLADYPDLRDAPAQQHVTPATKVAPESTEKPVQPSSTPTQSMATPKIVAPRASQRVTAMEQGKFVGAGKVSLGESAVEAKTGLAPKDAAVLETFKEVLPQAKEVSEELIQEELAYLQASMKKGVTPGGAIRDSEGYVVGHYPTVSHNERWYQDWMKAHKRPPNKAQLRELAIQRLERGGPVNSHEIGPNEEFLEAQQVIETVEKLDEKAKAPATHDLLKQKVAQIDQEQSGLANAAMAKFGEEGITEKIFGAALDIAGDIRSKESTRVSDPQVERVLTATDSAMTLPSQIGAKIQTIGDKLKDVFSYEWRLSGKPKFQEQIRVFQGVPDDAWKNARSTYKTIVAPMSKPFDMRVFSRLVSARDLLEEVRRGNKAAGDLTEAQLVKAEQELMAKASPAVKQALANHDAVMQVVWKELQRRGKVPADSPGKQHYYTHKVLDYIRVLDGKFPGMAQKLKAPYRLYTLKRSGTTRLIDTDYLNVMMKHLAKVYMDNAIDDFALDMYRQYDAWPNLSNEQKVEFGKKPEANRLYVINGERHFGVRYDPFHRADTPASTAVQDALVEFDPEVDKASDDFVNQVHVLPEVIADRLTRLRDPALNSVILNSLRSMQWAWKNILFGPFGVGIPWQLGNLIGDNINLFREDHMALLNERKAWKAAGQHQSGVISEQFQELLRVADEMQLSDASLIRAGGIPYDPVLAKLQPLRFLLKRFNIFEGYRAFNERRELTLKLAKLMTDMERIGKGEMPRLSQADTKRLIAGGMTPTEIAGKAAREVTVDYGRLTSEQKLILRDLLLPFSTFYLGNFKGWANYVQRRPGEFALKFMLPMAAMAAWNAMKFPEEEEKLPVYYRVVPHIITGYKTADGKPIIISMATPLDMAAKLIGLDIVPDLARQVLSGKKELDDAAWELAKNMALAPARETWNLFSTLFKAPIEAAMNKNTFTGAPIVDEAIKDTPEGIKKRLNYIAQQWLSPYGAYMRSNREVDVGQGLVKWAAKGPIDIKRGLGIREVDLEKETVNRFYDRLDKLEGAYAVWKDKRDKGQAPGAFTDVAEMKRLQAVARSLSDQWKVIDRIRSDADKTKEQRDKEVRARYVVIARRMQGALDSGK